MIYPEGIYREYLPDAPNDRYRNIKNNNKGKDVSNLIIPNSKTYKVLKASQLNSWQKQEVVKAETKAKEGGNYILYDTSPEVIDVLTKINVQFEVKEKTETRIETNCAFGFIPYENKYTINFKYLEIKGNSDAKSKPDKHD